MKKIFMMLAVAAMMIFAVSCGNDKKKEAKAETVDFAQMAPADLAQTLLKAAKDNDIDTFKAIFDLMEENESEAAEEALAALPEEDQMTIAFYALAHMEELTGEKLDFSDEADDEAEEVETEEDLDFQALLDDANADVEKAYNDAMQEAQDAYDKALQEAQDSFEDALKDLQ